jgi:hypothetical protein
VVDQPNTGWLSLIIPASLASFFCGFIHLQGLDLAELHFNLRYLDVAGVKEGHIPGRRSDP